jgi:DNA repair protein RadC
LSVCSKKVLPLALEALPSLPPTEVPLFRTIPNCGTTDQGFVRERGVVQSLEGSSNEELLASLAGRPAAARLMGKFGGLSSLAQASFADLQQVAGVGPSKAAASRSAFLLAQRLVRETYPRMPRWSIPQSAWPDCSGRSIDP